MPEIACPKCGQPLTLNTDTGMFRCPNCGFKRAETLDEAEERIRSRGAPPAVTLTYRGEVEPRVRSLFDGAQIYLWQGKKAEAIEALKEAIDIQPDFADAHLWIAKTTDDEQVKRYHLGEILAYDPANLEAMRMLLVLDGKMTPEEAELSQDANRAPMLKQADGAVKAKAVSLICPVCGGALTIDGESQRVVCKSCGYTAPLEEQRHASDGAELLSVALLRKRAQPVKWIVGERILHCNQCGAERTIPAGRLSMVCPFCGSNQVIQQDALDTIEQPDGLVPFTVSEEEAKTAIHERLKGIDQRLAGIFSDNKVVRATIEGIYLPYWVFDALLEVSKTVIDRSTSPGGSYQRNYTPVQPYQNSKFSDGLTGVPVAAVKSPPSTLTGQLGDFDTGAAAAYEPNLLAKYPASIYDVDFDKASLAMHSIASNLMRSRYGQAESRDTEVNIFTSVLQMSFTLMLLPVWVGTLYEHDGDVRSALVNGQTGKVALGKAQKVP